MVPVIMYHHVAETRIPRADTVSPKLFDYQLNFLKTRGYRVMGLDELVRGLKSQMRFPRKSVVLTFDDGYEDNFTSAFPLLEKYGYTATIFISPDFIGQQGYLTMEQIKRMISQGIQFGSHSTSHAYLPDCPPEELAMQVEGSKKFLEKELGVPIESFAYPVGGFNPMVKGLVPKAGYKAGLTTNRGQDRLNRDAYQLNRIRFSDKDCTDMILRTKLSGYYNLFRKFKNPY